MVAGSVLPELWQTTGRRAPRPVSPKSLRARGALRSYSSNSAPHNAGSARALRQAFAPVSSAFTLVLDVQLVPVLVSSSTAKPGSPRTHPVVFLCLWGCQVGENKKYGENNEPCGQLVVLSMGSMRASGRLVAGAHVVVSPKPSYRAVISRTAAPCFSKPPALRPRTSASAPCRPTARDPMLCVLLRAQFLKYSTLLGIIVF